MGGSKRVGEAGDGGGRVGAGVEGGGGGGETGMGSVEERAETVAGRGRE